MKVMVVIILFLIEFCEVQVQLVILSMLKLKFYLKVLEITIWMFDAILFWIVIERMQFCIVKLIGVFERVFVIEV